MGFGHVGFGLLLRVFVCVGVCVCVCVSLCVCVCVCVCVSLCSREWMCLCEPCDVEASCSGLKIFHRFLSMSISFSVFFFLCFFVYRRGRRRLWEGEEEQLWR